MHSSFTGNTAASSSSQQKHLLTKRLSRIIVCCECITIKINRYGRAKVLTFEEIEALFIVALNYAFTLDNCSEQN